MNLNSFTPGAYRIPGLFTKILLVLLVVLSTLLEASQPASASPEAVQDVTRFAIITDMGTSSGSGFGSSITFTSTTGSIANTPIYVRFERSTAGSSGGNISHTSPGADTGLCGSEWDSTQPTSQRDKPLEQYGGREPTD